MNNALASGTYIPVHIKIGILREDAYENIARKVNVCKPKMCKPSLACKLNWRHYWRQHIIARVNPLSVIAQNRTILGAFHLQLCRLVSTSVDSMVDQMEQHFQHEFSCNVWLQRLNGPAFLHFLENEFEAILDDMPLIDRANRWFQLDGCPAHYTLLVRQWLHNHFSGRWIGRGRDCPCPWPPRSPDLTTMDFYVWGRMKSKVYAEPVNDEASLRARILQAAQEIPLVECRAAAQSVIRRCQLCIENDGGHFEQKAHKSELPLESTFGETSRFVSIVGL
ncbi:hypothetical protein NQ318_022737 [Aromia moschata]|uniref:Uncharacterized protein n=1 Tax=Aromia moschata TaxID=1265417 RepID=A0AAV8YEA1_9CUCU|nr:hypothetical protein NQ318_022737 [Aromia moschata]